MTRILIGLTALIFIDPIGAAPTDSASPRAVVESVYAAFAEGDMETFAGLDPCQGSWTTGANGTDGVPRTPGATETTWLDSIRSTAFPSQGGSDRPRLR